MALSGKQLLFVDYYMQDPNQTAAYQRAYGCGEEAARKNGSRLMTNDDVKTEIERRQSLLVEKSMTSAQWVLERLIMLADRCMQAEAVTDREGNPTGEWKFDASGANKALENIGRYHGMFNDKLKVDAINNNLNQDLTNLPPDERRARIDELNRRRGTGANTAS